MIKKILPLSFAFVGSVGLATPPPSSRTAITLKQYIEWAQASDPSWKSAQMAKEGSIKTKNNSELLTSVNLIANSSYLSDGRPTVNPAFAGTKTINKSYAFGFQQKSLLGLSWSLTQNYSYTNIQNATLLPQPEYFDAYPKLELSIPLWRDWMGNEIQATKKQLAAQLKMQTLRNELSFIQKENEIKEAYINLATQQQNFEIQKDSLARAEKILGWAKSRFSRNLADQGDVYQIQALVAARKIDLVNAEMRLKEASRTFNAFLEKKEESVDFDLIMEDIDLKNLELSKSQHKQRMDLEIEKENINATEAGYQIQKEKNKPNINLNASYLRQGRDTEFGVAQSNVFREKKDSYMFAVQFSMPIDIGNLNDSKQGYEQLQQSQVLAEKVRARTETLQWKNTVDQAEALASQLKIIYNLEVIQKNKANLEREKYNNGRSTTYQVLNFEQDYVNTRNQRINTERELRKFINSLSLFR
ncbi:MAG: hypothetical protein RJB66_179 [Pseudomonadota bacterium]|jgi:outer membrane protein TolC